MSAFDIIQIRVVDTAGGASDGIGGEIETETDITGSPFAGRIYRSTSGSGYFRQDAAPGATTLERRRVVSLLGTPDTGGVKEGMTVIVPACAATGNRVLRGRIQRVGYYDADVQCELHTGGGAE